MPGKNKHIETKSPRPSGRGLKHRDNGKVQSSRFKMLWARHSRLITACAIFLVTVGLFIYLYSQLVGSRAFQPVLSSTARVTVFMLNLAGQGAQIQADGITVTSPRFSFQIVDLCTAILPMLILTAAVVAYPSRIKEKILGLLIGLPGIFVINQIRLISLFFIGAYAPGIFETAHLLVWQSLMILTAIGIWLIWVYRYVRPSAL